MFEDGTWKREIGKKNQIIALTTKLTEMQAKLEQQVAAFFTQQQSGGNKQENTQNAKSKGRSCRSKKEPYTAAAWRLIKKEDNVTVKGKEYFLVYRRSLQRWQKAQWYVSGSQDMRSRLLG